MKIASVQATWVHVPIPEARQHVSDFGRIASFDSVIVGIETDGGSWAGGITVDEDFVRRYTRA